MEFVASTNFGLPYLWPYVLSDGEMEQRTARRQNLRVNRRRNRLGSPSHIRLARCAEGR